MRSRIRDIVASLALVAISSVTTASCGVAGPTSAERDFVAAMKPHHALGIELISLAAPRADDVRLRRLVFEMSGYHHTEMNHLDHWMSDWQVAPATAYPGRIPPEHMARLAGLSGAEFDVAWLRAMIDHHEGALTIANRVIAAEPRPDIADMARTTVEVQSGEIASMRTLIDDLGAASP